MDTFLPFDDFIRSLKKRNVSRLKSFRGMKASNSNKERMRQHLEQYYKGIREVNSFVDEEGEIWDCIPVELQPGILHEKERHFEKLPPSLPGATGEENILSVSAALIDKDKTDQYGNRRYCPPGKVPVRRVTLQEIGRYTSLQSFFNKHRATTSTSFLSAATLSNRRQYVFGSQAVENFGADAITSLWQPRVGSGQFFSLAQIWVQGGSNAGLQTVETGWQVIPGRYNGSLTPRLFIYWTPDNYTTGSYNLEKGNTFRQVSAGWTLGGTLSPVSTVGGQQFEIRLSWRYFQGAWWLYINKEPIGYYPAALFGNGVLSKNSDRMIIGGEVSGSNSLPPMGSGQPGSAGAGKSAYWRNISYLLNNGDFRAMDFAMQATAPACYNFLQQQNPGWANGFFFGGPGGNNC